MKEISYLFLVALLAPGARSQEKIYKWFGDAPQSVFGGYFDCGRDLSSDGVSDFVIGEGTPTFDGKFFAYSGANGAILWAVTGATGEGLGTSLFLDDIDHDGCCDVIMSSANPPGGSPSGGAFTVYSGKTGSAIYSILGVTNQYLYATAVVDDIDRDGFRDFITRSFAPIEAEIRSGASGQIIYSIPAPADAADFCSTASSGYDVDQDGANDFLFADDFATPGGKPKGAVWLYSGKSGAFLFEVPGAIKNAHFGATATFMADVNSDGIPDFAVGAPWEHTYPEDWGHVHVYSGKDGSALLDLHPPGRKDQQLFFGGVIADAGDVNHDGLGDLLVEQIGGEWDNDFSLLGVVRIISGRDGAPLYHYFEPSVIESNFGNRIKVCPDLDGDGASEVMIGSSGESIDPTQFDRSGAAYVFRMNDLFIDPLPRAVTSFTSTLALTVGQGVPGNPFALYLVDVSGAPANLLLTVSILDSTGRGQLQGSVPPGLSGLVLGFKAFALDASNHVIDTGVESVTFE